MSNLIGKIALVTGASRGIGRSIVESFANAGARVYAVDIRDDGFEWLKEKCFENGGIVIPYLVDICDFDGVRKLFRVIMQDSNQLDILVNNAGIVTYETLSLINFDKLRAMFEVNVIALIYMMQLASRFMARKKGGSIINIASIVGLKGAKGQLSYSATKGAVISATLSASKELAEHNIRVNAIAPGMVATERFISVLDNNFTQKQEDIRFGRLAEPQDIANACLFFASDKSHYITGQILGVEGSLIL